MKSYFFYSAGLHITFLIFLATVGTLLSKPPKKYYSIDLMSAMSGGPAGAGPVSPTSEVKAAPTPAVPTPKIKTPKAPPAPAPVRHVEEQEPAEDTMRMLAQLKKKRLTQAKERRYEDYSNEDSRPSRNSEPAEAATPSRGGGSGNGGSNALGAGPGISVGNGTPFPFPWYIKAIYGKLDSKWKPPSNFDPGTSCVVSFAISRDGTISKIRMTKASQDSFFDGLAMRAVTAANPLPKLPDAYPEDTLDVHMTFSGK